MKHMAVSTAFARFHAALRQHPRTVMVSLFLSPILVTVIFFVLLPALSIELRDPVERRGLVGGLSGLLTFSVLASVGVWVAERTVT